MSISSLSKQRPFFFVGLLEAGIVTIFLAAFVLLRKLLNFTDPATVDLVTDGLGYAALTVITVILLNRLDWWQEAGFRRPYRWYFVLFFWLPLLPIILNFLGGWQIAAAEPGRIFIFLIVSLLIGFAEEGIFRGVMVRALSAKGMWTAAWVSAVLFGLAHSVNILLGENIQAVLLQVVYATTIYGFASAALVIYTGTIWPLVVIHFLTDFTSWLQAGSSLQTTGVTFGDVFITVVGSVLAIGYGVILLTLAKKENSQWLHQN